MPAVTTLYEVAAKIKLPSIKYLFTGKYKYQVYIVVTVLRQNFNCYVNRKNCYVCYSHLKERKKQNKQI